jgi:quercetin dioxygenase-like cupin family protein
MRYFQDRTFTAICAALMLVSFSAGLATHNALAASKGRLKVRSLFKQDLHNIEGKEILVVELNLEPGASSPAHKHPGHVVGYVIEGSYEVQLNDDEPKVFDSGQVFYEPDGAIHTVGRNPSDSKSAKVVVFMLMEEGEPATSLHVH